MKHTLSNPALRGYEPLPKPPRERSGRGPQSTWIDRIAATTHSEREYIVRVPLLAASVESAYQSIVRYNKTYAGHSIIIPEGTVTISRHFKVRPYLVPVTGDPREQELPHLVFRTVTPVEWNHLERLGRRRSDDLPKTPPSRILIVSHQGAALSDELVFVTKLTD